MSEQGSVALEATGLNPHYKPPIMRWNRVEIVGVRGLEFGIIEDCQGVLTLAVKMAGAKWRPGYEPDPGSTQLLADPAFVFQVINDERGPAREHEFQPDPDDADQCVICRAQAQDGGP
jgi:hypothetical protein